MRHTPALAAAILCASLPAWADIYVAGSTSGTWDTGTNRWEYAASCGGTSDVTFTGATFGPGATPFEDVYLGKILLNNGALFDGRRDYSNTLDLAINFTQPNGYTLEFLFPLTVKASASCFGFCDVLVDLSQAAQTKSITLDGSVYTATLHGFFNECGQNVTSLQSLTGSTASARLYGDFTATSVPEPGAAALLAAMLAAVPVAGFLRSKWWRA